MAQNEKDLSKKLRDVILNTRSPLVFRRFPANWSCFRGTLSDWCRLFDKETHDALPSFERMSLSDTETPQWERKRTQVTMTAEQFLEEHQVAQPYWSAYHYKSVTKLPAVCLEGVDFGCFGFADHQSKSTLWLSSQGANTPCHYDTFGVNVVVQVYGSKSWLLFSPEASLQTTRIPFEETSVYCLENFYAPAPEKLDHYEKHQRHAYHCTLQPGDVLIVPRHWWHYVETQELSLSINYWVPIKRDFDVLFDELITKHIVESFVKGENNEVKHYVLNPNQLDQIVATPSQLFSQFEIAAENAEQSNDSPEYWDTEYLSHIEVMNLLNSIDLTVQLVDAMSQEAYMKLLSTNSKRFTKAKTNESNVVSPMLDVLVNSMCAPRSIELIKREFFQRLKQSDNL